MEQVNRPYVKILRADGVVHNPISGDPYNGRYIHNFPNRRERRSKTPRFRGNHKGVSLTVTQNSKYKRIIQLVEDSSKKVVSVIYHYLASSIRTKKK